MANNTIAQAPAGADTAVEPRLSYLEKLLKEASEATAEGRCLQAFRLLDELAHYAKAESAELYKEAFQPMTIAEMWESRA